MSCFLDRENAKLKTFVAPFLGSFCRYRGTYNVQQKKQYNQRMKPPGELYCLVPLFLWWWQYLEKEPVSPDPTDSPMAFEDDAG